MLLQGSSPTALDDLVPRFLGKLLSSWCHQPLPGLQSFSAKAFRIRWAHASALSFTFNQFVFLIGDRKMGPQATGLL